MNNKEKIKFIETIQIREDQNLDLSKFGDFQIVIEESTRSSIIFKNQKVLEIV